MNRPRSQFLSHRYPAWRGCTIQELALLLVAVFSACVTLGLVLGSLFGYRSLWLLGACLLAALVFTTVTKWFAEAKKGTPYHYLLSRVLYQFHIGRRRRVTHLGAWATHQTDHPSRRLSCHD